LRAGLFGPVHDGERFHSGGNSLDKRFGGEGAVKSYFYHTDLLTFCVEVIHGFFNRFRAAAHDDYHAVRVGSAVVVDEVVLSARERADLIHLRLYDRGDGVVVFIGSFSVLEVDIGVLRGALLMGMLRIESAGAELVHLFEVDKLFYLVILDRVDLAHLVRSAEAVEEAQERHARFESGEVRDKRQIHDLLHAVGREHGKSRLAARHDVGVVAEDVERVAREASCGNVEDGRQQFAGDFIHIGDHKKQALACGERAGERACRERAVHGACRARFGLHLGDPQNVAEDVLSALTCPVVAVFCHW